MKAFAYKKQVLFFIKGMEKRSDEYLIYFFKDRDKTVSYETTLQKINFPEVKWEKTYYHNPYSSSKKCGQPLVELVFLYLSPTKFRLI